MEEKFQDRPPLIPIVMVSIVVPVLVGFLFFFDEKLALGNFVYQLPHFHGILNSLTSLLLVIALVMIKIGNVKWHKILMSSAVCMGAIFLISYVTYHSSVESVIFGDANGDGLLSDSEKGRLENRGTYLVILLSHIALSLVTLPVVLLAFIHALKGNFVRHRFFVRFAYPMWLYVSVTGVVVYMMMRPYYF